MFFSCFFMIHDTSTCGQDNISKIIINPLVLYSSKLKHSINIPKLTRWQQSIGPFLNIQNWNVKSGTDDTSFVQATSQIDDNLSSAVIIYNFEFADVSVLHHNSQELNDDFGVWADENMTLSAFFSVVNAFQSIG